MPTAITGKQSAITGSVCCRVGQRLTCLKSFLHSSLRFADISSACPRKYSSVFPLTISQILTLFLLNQHHSDLRYERVWDAIVADPNRPRKDASFISLVCQELENKYSHIYLSQYLVKKHEPISHQCAQGGAPCHEGAGEARLHAIFADF